MRGVDRERREHRIDVVHERVGQRGPVGIAEIRPADEPDAGFFERGRDVLRERRRLAPQELRSLFTDGAQLVDRIEAIGSRRADPGGDPLTQTRDADLEELVEVLRKDREETHTLQEWQLGVLGQRQHP